MLLAPDELARLLKLLGMLGSEHSGERAAAALKAHQFVESRELTWAELLDPADAPLPIVSVGVADNHTHNPAPGGPPLWATNPPPPPPNPIPPTSQWPKHLRFIIDQHLLAGRKIEAVRDLKTHYNASLKEARYAIDVLYDLHFRSVPNPSPFMKHAAATPAASNSKLNFPTWQDCVRHMRAPINAAFIRGQKEESFLFDLTNRPDTTPLTIRQASWLSDICDRANITWQGNPQNMLDPL